MEGAHETQTLSTIIFFTITVIIKIYNQNISKYITKKV